MSAQYRCKTEQTANKEYKYVVKLLVSHDSGKSYKETGIEYGCKTKMECLDYIKRCRKEYNIVN